MRLDRLCLMIVMAALCPAMALGGPREFGLDELQRALTDRGLSAATLPLRTEIRPGPAESFEILADRVIGADERGLMYGLLAAAEQIRTTGRLRPEQGAPYVPLRGVRYFLHNEALEADWYYSRDHWNAYFAMLARQRFNRFNLVFAHQTAYLAPPYPFWLALPEFPEVRVPGLSPDQRRRNLDTLCAISRAAADHGIDFTLGIWQHDVQADRGMRSTVAGLTAENIGPYSYAALKRVLATCPAIKAVQLRTNDESGIPPDRQLAFYRDHVIAAVRDSGRAITLDLRGWGVSGGLVDAAGRADVPLRLSTKYWAEHLGRPYQPAETYPGYSYGNFLAKPRPYRFFWELWGLGSHRLLLWGNPDYVRRTVSTLRLGEAEGFEIDPPLAQKGFGNRPGKWGVFTDAELPRRRFWRWEWERYWLFYTLWGRLSFDPGMPDAVWEAELARRFGDAAPDVMDAYRHASEVIHELVAVHLVDPNMYWWPEISPGGLIDAYAKIPPSDWRYVASITEAVRNRLQGHASAKHAPEQTAARLDRWAQATEHAIARARSRVAAGQREWLASEPDFLVLAALARYHARKQRAAEALAWFDATSDPAALARARRETEAAVAIWEGLVALTDGLYPDEMAFGPDDVGHWKDKLPYVRHDLRLIEDREAVLRRFGRFDLGFDFGGPVPAAPGELWQDTSARLSTVAPRFLPADPGTLYDEGRGYGWLGEGRRETVAIPPTPEQEMRSVAKTPGNLPRDVLLRDALRGQGSQTFAIKVGPGDYTVTIVDAEGVVDVRPMRAEGGRLLVTFPDRPWSVSALIVQGSRSREPLPVWSEVPVLPRPVLRHQPVATGQSGQPLTLTLEMPDTSGIQSVRLHYRPVNQLAQFKVLEAPPSAPRFIIPGSDITPEADLMYYFEVLVERNGSWFHPDPHTATPYYVVTTLRY